VLSAIFEKTVIEKQTQNGIFIMQLHLRALADRYDGLSCRTAA